MKVILKSKHNLHFATGEWTKEKTIVIAGSKINIIDSFPRMSETISSLRKNPKYIDENGVLIQDVSFDTPSSAAQFVTGRSVNGYIAWRPDDKMSLKDYLKKEN